jgi:streptogramin lyase
MKNLISIVTGLALAGLLLGASRAAAQTATLGTTNLLEGPAAGTDSVVLGVIPATNSWTASPNATWLHLAASQQSGTGSTNVIFTFDANPGATRTGTLTVAGIILTVTQAGTTYISTSALMTLASSGLSQPCGVAVDGTGNVYFSDGGHNAIKEWSAASGSVTTLVSSGLNNPCGVAVDGAGNVYIADPGNNAIKKWSVASGLVSTVVSAGLNVPLGVAVDPMGNVYIADTLNSAVEMWTAATTTLSTLVSTGLSSPWGVTVDNGGNVIIADTGNNAVKKWTAATGAESIVIPSGLRGPSTLALDWAGNIYIANIANNVINKWSAATGGLTTFLTYGLPKSANYPASAAIDGAGNIYLADYQGNAIEELPRAFVDATPKSEPITAGSDALPVVLPATEILAGPLAPVSDSPWLTITGITNGVVSFAFSSNYGASRLAHISLLGNAIAISQAGFMVALGTNSLFEPIGAGSDQVALTFPSLSGLWTATANDPWLHLSPANQTGTGSATVVFTFDANPGPSRTGTLTIADQTLTVNQPSRPLATNVVTSLADSGPGSLRAQILNSVPGDTITFATNGTLVLTGGELLVTNNLSLIGPGATNVTISGNYSSRIFEFANGATGLLSGLSLINGQAPAGTTNGMAGGSGGAILGSGGALTLQNCALTGNQAGPGGTGNNGDPGRVGDSSQPGVGGPGGPGSGGGPGGAGGAGGAVCNSGPISLADCSLVGNQAGAGGPGGGGGVGGVAGKANGNGRGGVSGPGGAGGAGGNGGFGGAIAGSGPLALVACTLSGNTSGVGGLGGPGGPGGNGINGGDSGNGGNGNDGGAGGAGGAVYGSGLVALTNCTLNLNLTASGGAAGTGGNTGNDNFAHDPGNAGDGSPGGTGGAVYGLASVSLTSCTLSGNAAGSGGAGGLSGSFATQGLDPYYRVTMGSVGASGHGGGVASSNCVVWNSLVALNNAAPGPDISGPVSSLGHNLIGNADGSSGLTNGVNADQAGTMAAPLNPWLGPLQNNGGPAFTLALLAGSPAIDAGDDALLATLTTDQRGFPRLAGAHVDIGAYELQSGVFTVGLSTSSLIETASAGSGNVALAISSPTVAWVATANAAWLHLSPASQRGIGSATVSFTFDENHAPPRTVTVIIAGQTLVITQAGGNRLGASTLLEGPAAGADSVALQDFSLVPAWSAAVNTPWLHLSPANQAGTGSTNVVFTFDANPGVTRVGTLTIAGQTTTVTQAGAAYVAASGTFTTLVSSELFGNNGYPTGVAVDGVGNVYITDPGNTTIEEWAAASGTFTNLVSAGLDYPQGVAVDAAGNVYIADSNLYAIKEWLAASGTVTTLVSSGLGFPNGVAVDGAGNVYVADYGNNAIEEWSPASGAFTTLVSSNSLTPLNGPQDVAVDGAGNVYMSDSGNNAIEEWSPASGMFTTLVSSGLFGPNGYPTGVAVDGVGNVYIADAGNNTIEQWVAASGTFTTLVSSGLFGPYGYPTGVAVDGEGNVYVADYGNETVEELPRALVDPTPKIEPVTAGSDALPLVLPATENLAGDFAPASDSPWLTITGVTNGVVSYAFTANPTLAPRTALLTVLGQTIPITQPGSGPILTGSSILPNGSFHFSFTGTAGASYSIWFTTNLALPFANWTGAGPATVTTPGQFQFTAPPVPGTPAAYYQVTSP